MYIKGLRVVLMSVRHLFGRRMQSLVYTCSVYVWVETYDKSRRQRACKKQNKKDECKEYQLRYASDL